MSILVIDKSLEHFWNTWQINTNSIYFQNHCTFNASVLLVYRLVLNIILSSLLIFVYLELQLSIVVILLYFMFMYISIYVALSLITVNRVSKLIIDNGIYISCGCDYLSNCRKYSNDQSTTKIWLEAPGIIFSNQITSFIFCQYQASRLSSIWSNQICQLYINHPHYRTFINTDCIFSINKYRSQSILQNSYNL